MANVARELERIENATYGEEVRSSIHDAIQKMNEQAVEAYETAVTSQESSLNSKNAAETAQRAAEEAQGKAEMAQDAAEEAQNKSEAAQAITESARDEAVGARDTVVDAKNTAVAARDEAVNANGDAQAAKIAAKTSEDNAHEYYNDTYDIYTAIGSGFQLKGPATIETLPANAEPGWKYVLTSQGITDNRFAEGAGLIVSPGTMVYYTVDGMWSIQVQGEQSMPIDSIPIQGSNNAIASNAVYQVLHSLKPISEGGTGGTTAEDALENLGINQALHAVKPISEGGTGATTAEEARANLGLNDTWEPLTLNSSAWNEGSYSFEDDYPSESYDILNILPASSATNVQRMAWSQADCGGYYAENVIVSHGIVPQIDIPVVLNIRSK